MAIGTQSLLLALLEPEALKYPPTTPREGNISEVVDAIKNKKASLAKDVAQRKLYEVLYSIIEKDYDSMKSATDKDKENEELNFAIGLALESAIKGGRLARNPRIVKLRDKLRGEITKALDPQPSPK